MSTQAMEMRRRATTFFQTMATSTGPVARRAGTGMRLKVTLRPER